MKSTKKKTAKAKPPTFAEMQAVVQAWVKTNWPEAKHVVLSECISIGGGEREIDLLGPPTDEPWFTNDLPRKPREYTAEELAEKIKELDAEKVPLLQPPLSQHNDADDADTRMPLVAWWGETMAILNAIASTARRVAKELRPGGSLEGLMDADGLSGFASRLEDLATQLSNNTPRPMAELSDPLEEADPTFEDVKRVTLAWLEAKHPDYTDTDVELTLMEPHGTSRKVFSMREADEEEEDGEGSPAVVAEGGAA